MSEPMQIVIITTIASLISIGATYLIGMWVNKRKVPAEVKQINADTDLKSGELVSKWRGIVDEVTDDNIELTKRIREGEEEKKQIMQAMSQLRSDMEEQNKTHCQEIEALRKSFEEERIENLKWRDWASRLVQQLNSWRIVPVPFDLDEAKKDKLSLGDFGFNSEVSNI